MESSKGMTLEEEEALLGEDFDDYDDPLAATDYESRELADLDDDDRFRSRPSPSTSTDTPVAKVAPYDNRGVPGSSGFGGPARISYEGNQDEDKGNQDEDEEIQRNEEDLNIEPPAQSLSDDGSSQRTQRTFRSALTKRLGKTSLLGPYKSRGFQGPHQRFNQRLNPFPRPVGHIQNRPMNPVFRNPQMMMMPQQSPRLLSLPPQLQPPALMSSMGPSQSTSVSYADMQRPQPPALVPTMSSSYAMMSQQQQPMPHVSNAVFHPSQQVQQLLPQPSSLPQPMINPAHQQSHVVQSQIPVAYVTNEPQLQPQQSYNRELPQPIISREPHIPVQQTIMHHQQMQFGQQHIPQQVAQQQLEYVAPSSQNLMLQSTIAPASQIQPAASSQPTAKYHINPEFVLNRGKYMKQRSHHHQLSHHHSHRSRSPSPYSERMPRHRTRNDYSSSGSSPEPPRVISQQKTTVRRPPPPMPSRQPTAQDHARQTEEFLKKKAVSVVLVNPKRMVVASPMDNDDDYLLDEDDDDDEVIFEGADDLPYQVAQRAPPPRQQVVAQQETVVHQAPVSRSYPNINSRSNPSLLPYGLQELPQRRQVAAPAKAKPTPKPAQQLYTAPPLATSEPISAPKPPPTSVLQKRGAATLEAALKRSEKFQALANPRTVVPTVKPVAPKPKVLHHQHQHIKPVVAPGQSSPATSTSSSENRVDTYEATVARTEATRQRERKRVELRKYFGRNKVDNAPENLVNKIIDAMISDPTLTEIGEVLRSLKIRIEGGKLLREGQVREKTNLSGTTRMERLRDPALKCRQILLQMTREKCLSNNELHSLVNHLLPLQSARQVFIDRSEASQLTAVLTFPTIGMACEYLKKHSSDPQSAGIASAELWAE